MFERVKSFFTKTEPRRPEPIEPTTGNVVRDIAEAEEEITSYLRDVFHEKAYAEYVGGTLFVNKKMLDSCGKIIEPARVGYMFNVEDDSLPEEVRKWVCLCYLKYKNYKHIYYNTAMSYVVEHQDAEAALSLLSVL